MAMNIVWAFFFLAAFVVAIIKLLFLGDTQIFQHLIDATFDASKSGFEISLGLAGVMTLWLGLIKIGEKAGVISIFAKWIEPLFSRLFPDIPAGHPALGHIVMNFSANLLGLGNAATPLGLTAMQSLQEVNENKDEASNAQIMFLVMNTGGFTLLPITILMFRSQFHAAMPADVFIPILIASFVATLAGIVLTALKQGIRLTDKIVMGWLAAIVLFLVALMVLARSLTAAQLSKGSGLASNFILFSLIIVFLTVALKRGVNVFEAFIEGAKQGFETVVKIIPYLVGILVGIAVFRASGGMDILLKGIAFVLPDPALVQALPTAFMKPLSGSGARACMVDAMNTYGVDSFTGRLSAVFQGAGDTTFYIVALYFGAVGIRNSRYAITYGLITDAIGIVVAALMCYIFFR